VAEVIGNVALMIAWSTACDKQGYGNVALQITWSTACDKQGYGNDFSWKLHEIFVSKFFDKGFLQYLNQLDFKSFSNQYHFISRLHQLTEC
jgi:hypothetical protein